MLNSAHTRRKRWENHTLVCHGERPLSYLSCKVTSRALKGLQVETIAYPGSTIGHVQTLVNKRSMIGRCLYQTRTMYLIENPRDNQGNTRRLDEVESNKVIVLALTLTGWPNHNSRLLVPFGCYITY